MLWLKKKMITKNHIDKMFIRQELDKGQDARALEIEKKAHELALLIQQTIRTNKTVEEAIIHVKTAAMLARVAIATENKD